MRIKKVGKEKYFSPVDIKTFVEIQNILKIDEEASVMSLKFKVFFTWFDYQLTYRHLKTDYNHNMVNMAKEKI